MLWTALILSDVVLHTSWGGERGVHDKLQIAAWICRKSDTVTQTVGGWVLVKISAVIRDTQFGLTGCCDDGGRGVRIC
ncbi:hypothetical protein F5Y04DRAFT_17435 [Hypomontagnella monticulosa]|nr:hypothetical protein F5Y04DRAFT_17435 [Hypomontagnella monticulosa]